MKRFLQDVFVILTLVGTIIVVIVCFDYLFIGNQYEQGYQSSLIDKVHRLESIDEPKIILVGNSNVAFGFRSEIIEKEFSMPVVNCGLHGNLGNRFNENIARLNINEGDIVVLCHTSYADNNKIGDTELALITLEWNTELWKILDPIDTWKILEAVPNYILNATVCKITRKGNIPGTDCYSRNAFNEYGDNVYADNDNKKYVFKEGELDNHIPVVGKECVERINELNEIIKSKGATLVIAGFPIADGEFTPNHEVYDEFETELKNRVDCAVISTCDDYYFPYEYFYDTVFHLTKEGAIARTYCLVKDLKSFISNENSRK